MKSFKEYIREKVNRDIINYSKAVDKVMSPENGRFIPISPAVVERIYGSRKKVKSYHVTNDQGFLDLMKIQGTKKAVATATLIRATEASRGVAHAGGIVVQIEGYPLFGAEKDLFSGVDESGRRWLKLRAWEKSVPDKHRKKFQAAKEEYEATAKKTASKWIDKFLKEFPEKNVRQQNLGYLRVVMSNVAYDSAENKEKVNRMKADIVKEYMDNAEKWIKKHSNLLSIYFMSAGPKPKITNSVNNELIMNQVKIKKVFVTAKRSNVYGNWFKKKKFDKKFPTEYGDVDREEDAVRRYNKFMGI